MQLKGSPPTRRRRSQAGFTALEVIVSTAIGLVALATAGAFNRFQLFALRNQANQVDIQTTARSVVDLFAREVRRAGMDPTCVKTFSAVAQGGPTSVRIQSDLNGNGVIDGTNEDITYAYTNGQVVRTANGTTDVLVSGLNLNGSTLRYFDSAGTELVPPGGVLSAAQRAAVQRVRIELALQGSAVDPLNSLPLIARVSTDVDLRNRFFIAGTGCP